MLKRKMLTAAFIAVGLLTTLEYKSIAQSTQPTPGASPQTQPTTQSSPSASPQAQPTTQSSPSANPQSQTQLSASDKQFITQAAQGGMAEVQMGQLALKQASSDAVRKYAQQMIDEHTKVNKELMSLATKKGVTPPTTIGPKYEAVRAKLSKLSGKNFDSAYMKEAGITAHSQQADLFQRQAGQGQDPDLKAFAAKTLPAVQMHLQMAREMTGDTSTGTTTPSASPSPSPSPTSTSSPK